MSRVLGLMCAFMLVALTSASTLSPNVDATHEKRIVWPYGVDERWVPVIAGFKVVPDPLQCDAGTPIGQTFYSNDFEGEDTFGLTYSKTHSTHNNAFNQWHTTDFAGSGTEAGHSAPGRLYFGNDATGEYRDWFYRVSGAATFELEIPETLGPLYLTMNTKWSGEWLEGYDHMWIEVDTGDDVFILCTMNPEGRGDPTSTDSTPASCSPYRTIPCPSDARRVDPLNLGDRVDANAPHWEARYVEIPSFLAGSTATIRFTFDSADGVSNRYMGWMVDDLALTDLVLPEVPMTGVLAP